MVDVPLYPMTELEAVNIMLLAVGQGQIMSLDNLQQNEESQKAYTTLGNVNRDVQMRGWHCNEETEVPFIPDTTGIIKLPNNIGAWTLNERSYAMDVTTRGQQLYDRKAHSFTFTQTVYANTTLILDFTDLPPPLRWYITARAGRLFAVGRNPDTGTFKLTNEVENDAWANALTFDTESRGTTLPDTSWHFANMRRR